METLVAPRRAIRELDVICASRFARGAIDEVTPTMQLMASTTPHL